MKICYKCNTEKEDKEFQTYWHSTQKKFRIRKECTKCLYKQKNERKRLRRKEAKLIDIYVPREIVQPAVTELQSDLFNDKNYKQCRTCQQFKIKTDYYSYTKTGKKSFLDCKICLNKKEVDRARKDRIKYLEENGGSNLVLQKTNQYVDKYQKDATFNLMKRFGWTFNEENGIWWKEGIKTPDGVFINVTKTKIKKKPHNIRIENKEEMFNQMLKLRETGLSFDKIGKKLGVSDTTIYKWIKKYNEKSN